MKKLVVLTVFLCIAPAFGEAYGNSAVFFPKAGMAFFDKPVGMHKKPWGIPFMWTVGTAYMQALDYRWWWLVDTNFAMGKLSVEERPFISAFMGGAGVRQNILLEDFRPHWGLMIHYLQFFGDSTKFIPLDLGWPIFVGLKVSGGLEWLVASEMGLLAELGYALYINLNEPFRSVATTQIAWVIYF